VLVPEVHENTHAEALAEGQDEADLVSPAELVDLHE